MGLRGRAAPPDSKIIRSVIAIPFHTITKGHNDLILIRIKPVYVLNESHGRPAIPILTWNGEFWNINVCNIYDYFSKAEVQLITYDFPFIIHNLVFQRT